MGTDRKTIETILENNQEELQKIIDTAHAYECLYGHSVFSIDYDPKERRATVEFIEPSDPKFHKVLAP